MSTKTNLSLKIAGVMAAVLASKLFSFVRTAVCAAIFGATAQTDAFNVGVNVLSMISGISSSLTTVIVPVRTQQLEERGRKAADEYSSSLLNIVLLISTILAIASVILAPQLVGLFAPEFTGDQFALTVSITRLMLPIIVFMASVNIFSGILNTHSRFLPGQLIGIPLGIGWMGVPLLMAKAWGIYALAAGYMLGTAMQLILLIPALKGIFRYSFRIDFKDPAIKKTLLMCIPVFIGSYALIINQIIDKALASGLAEGSISALAYGTQLIGLVQGIIIIPITTTIFTSLSSFVQKNDMKETKNLLMRVCSALVLILVPIMAYCLMFDSEIIRIVYQRGSFDNAANMLTSQAFFYYSLSLLPYGVGLVFTRCFYALHDTRMPLYTNIASVIVNVALNFILVRFMQIGGLALATSIASLMTSISLGICLRKKIGPMGIFNLMKDFLRVVGACIPLVIVALLIKSMLTSLSPLLNLVLASAAGLAVYFVILLVLRHSDALIGTRAIADFVRSRLGRHDGG